VFTLPSSVSEWLSGIAGAAIGGAATAGSTWMGMSVAKEAGFAVPTLNLKALGTILVSGALTNLFFYLKTSPVPQRKEQTTVTVTKESSGDTQHDPTT